MWRIMRISLVIFLAIILVSLVFESSKNNPQLILKNLIKKGNLEGDRLTFQARFLGVIPMGTANLENKGIEILRGKRVYHLAGGGKTPAWLSVFFKAEASCDSFIEKDKLHSLEFRQHLSVSEHPTEDKVIIYDQDNLAMDTGKEKRQILPHTHDPLSLMFYIQRQVFSLGKEFDLNINTNQKNYQFKAKIIDKKSFLLDNKKVDVWLLMADVRRRDKSGRNSSTAHIWFLDNPAKTPFLVKVMTKIGSITIRLMEVSD